jgi:hypothetical protein
MEDPLKLRYEKIGKEDLALNNRMQALKPLMITHAENCDIFREKLEELCEIETKKDLDLMEDEEIIASTLQLNKLGELQKEWMDSMKRFIAHMQANPTIIKDVFDFVNVLNAAYEKMATGKLTKEQVSTHITYMETDLLEIQTRYNLYEEECFGYINELKDFFIKLETYKR